MPIGITDAEAALRRLGVKELTLGDSVPGRLAAMRALAGLKMPGCCVLLAAQEHAGSVASFDADLLAAARRVGVETLGQP